MRIAVLALLMGLLSIAGPFTGPAAAASADIVFIIDATSGMQDEITVLASEFGRLPLELANWSVDTRYAIVLFGGEPELVLDFTSDASATQTALNTVSATGAVAGFQNDHSTATLEAGLEAIRLVLGTATTGVLNHDNVSGSGVLSFRASARTVIVIITDEDSDRPSFAGNRLSGQTTQEPPTFPIGTDWQLEVDGTAQDMGAAEAFFFGLVNPADAPTRYQYGDPFSLVSNPDFSGINFTMTYQQLVAQNYAESLQGQLLGSGLISALFDINSILNAAYLQNAYAAIAYQLSEQPVAAQPTTWGRLKRSYR